MYDNNYINRIPFIDGHNDTLKKLFLLNENVYNSNGKSHIDILKAKKAIFKGGFFAILAVAEKLEERKSGYGLHIVENGWSVDYPRALNQEYAQRFTDDVLEYLIKETKKFHDLKIIKSYKELEKNIFTNNLSVILHFEGAEAIKSDLSNLEDYYRKGLRSLGLVWSRANDFGYGVPFRFPSDSNIGEGLTLAGKELIKKCNDMGILIDLAHINEKGFFDAVRLSKAPIVVSHAGVHSICKSSTNLSDRQIDAVKDSNGNIGIIFDVLNTRPDGQYVKNSPMNIINEHIEYVINRIGIDHVSFGSDFDGGVIPDDIEDITGIPKLINCLQQLGYSQEDIEKVCYKNWLRVIRDTWKGDN
ncbi:dipeptidase [Vallitalea sp.]|jgi:membrane dipeptidase|uniref:dipeptidase n=1 Tax=Vallitalea sp. TaxID=1882829 RepID=UPI0025F29DC6|nr:dipeptidase [Vallitalea sp.]MCT4686724.1 dipeptidase [Vallitalea sp.]